MVLVKDISTITVARQAAFWRRKRRRYHTTASFSDTHPGSPRGSACRVPGLENRRVHTAEIATRNTEKSKSWVRLSGWFINRRAASMRGSGPLPLKGQERNRLTRPAPQLQVAPVARPRNRRSTPGDGETKPSAFPAFPLWCERPGCCELSFRKGESNRYDRAACAPYGYTRTFSFGGMGSPRLRTSDEREGASRRALLA